MTLLIDLADNVGLTTEQYLSLLSQPKGKAHSMRKSIGIAGLAATAALVIGSALPAMADTGPSSPGQDVQANVQIQTTIQLRSVTSSLDFGQILPGTAKTLSSAESPEVITNSSHGASLVIGNENGGFHVATAQPDIIPDSAVTVTDTTSHASVALSESGPVQVSSFAGPGDFSHAEDWTLNVAPTTPAGDPLFATFTYIAIAG